MKTLISVVLLFSLFGCNRGDVAEETPKHASRDEGSLKTYKFTDYDTIPLLPASIKKYNMVLGSPKTWQHSINDGLDVWKMPCSDSDAYCANYVVNVVPITKVSSLDEYSFAFTNTFKNRKDIDHFKLISSTKDTVDNRQAEVIDFIYSTNNTNLGGTTLLVLANDKLVIINFAALNDPPKSYVRYRGLYDRIIKSVKIH